jgi:hypothetical protein
LAGQEWEDPVLGFQGVDGLGLRAYHRRAIVSECNRGFCSQVC